MAEPTHFRNRLEPLALVALGGAAGATCRYLLAGVAGDVPGVLFANVLGSLALAFLVYEDRYTPALGARGRLLVATGFLSSFTTYSAFAVQTATAGDLTAALTLVAATYGLGLSGAAAGRALALRVGDATPTPAPGGDAP